MKLWEVMIPFNCSEFHHLMMVLSHSIITETLRYFSCLANETIFELHVCRSPGPLFLFFCAVVLVLSKAGCVYLCMLVKQLVPFISPVAAEGRDAKKNIQKHIVWEMGRQPWEDNSCWLENASWLLKANAFSALQPSLRVRIEGREGGGGCEATGRRRGWERETETGAEAVL